MKFLTIRHLHDQNALRTYGQDGPLQPNQEVALGSIVSSVLSELESANTRNLRLVSTGQTRRFVETVALIVPALRQHGVSVSVQHDPRLEVMDQGDLNLPNDYQDGDWFTPLDVAWDAICDEAYLKDNIFYRFGDHLDGAYPELEHAFSRTGESMGWSLINKYDFINDLVRGQLANQDELLAVVGQSDLPLLLMELEVLQTDTSVTAENLPVKCWEVYKSGLQAKMYDDHAVGDGNFDIPMGYVGRFDLRSMVDNGFAQVIQQAKEYLQVNSR